MLQSLARNWWTLVLRGVLGILFGVVALFWPGITITALVLVFGAYALVDGVFAIIAGIRRATEQRDRWWALVLEGLLGVGAGIVAFVWPGITTLALLYLIAAWAILTGVFEIIAAIRLRKEIEGEFWLGLGGLASVIFGLLLLLRPAAGALAVIWIIGMYGIVFGIVMILLGFRLRGWQDRRSDAGMTA